VSGATSTSLQAETPSGPRSALGTILTATRHAPALRRGFGLTLVLAFVATLGQLIVPITVQQVIDRELAASGPVDTRGVLAGGGLAVLGLVIALWANRVALFRLVSAAARGLAQLRVVAFDRIQRRSSLHVHAERRGVLVARVTSDIEAINDFLEWGGVGMIVGGAQVVVVLVVMTVYDPVLAVMVAGAGVLYALLLLFFQKVLRRAYDRVRVLVGESLGAMSEAISGLPTIRAYGAERRTLEKVDGALEAQYRAEGRTGTLAATMFSTAELFAASVTAAVVTVGLVVSDGVTAGQLVAFLFLVTLFIEPVQVLVEVLNEAQTAAAGVRRVLEVVDAPDELPDPGSEGQSLPPGPLSVQVEGVRFRYPTGADVLVGLDVDLRAGTRYAIVGETGSGKSTFVKLVTRLLDPTEGTIHVSGVPLTRVAFDELRSRVTFVPQDGFLWDTTLLENLRYGRPDAGDDEVVEAMEQLGLTWWIDRLPDGMATEVGERGARLSAGERQLVALGRAWLAHPDLLVLDEATSAVDPALEVSLRRAIERLTEGRTSLTVAHRLSTAEAADEVLVFDAGRLVEQGTHRELVGRDGVYARLHTDWITSTGITPGEGEDGGPVADRGADPEH
jgi:ATP-binding cassette, subfamily B, bacterial